MATLIQCDRCRTTKKHDGDELPDCWGKVWMTWAPKQPKPIADMDRELCPNCMRDVQKVLMEPPPIHKPT